MMNWNYIVSLLSVIVTNKFSCICFLYIFVCINSLCVIKYFTTAAICNGFNFPAKFVIHVNSPTWGNANAQQLLEKAVKSILTLADNKNLRSVALPSISSGK